MQMNSFIVWGIRLISKKAGLLSPKKGTIYTLIHTLMVSDRLSLFRDGVTVVHYILPHDVL